MTLLSSPTASRRAAARPSEAIAAHLQLARELLGQALAWRAPGRAAAARPRRRARRASSASRPGPQLGTLLARARGGRATRARSPRASEAIARARARRAALRAGAAASRTDARRRQSGRVADRPVVDVRRRCRARPVVVGRDLVLRDRADRGASGSRRLQRDQAVGGVARAAARGAGGRPRALAHRGDEVACSSGGSRASAACPRPRSAISSGEPTRVEADDVGALGRQRAGSGGARSRACPP